MGPDIPPRSTANRPRTILLFSATIAWQIYVIVSTHLQATPLKKLFSEANADLPPFTQVFFLSYPWWFLVPIVFIVLFVILLRRPDRSPWCSAALIGASLLVGFVLQAIADQALFGQYG